MNTEKLSFLRALLVFIIVSLQAACSDDGSVSSGRCVTVGEARSIGSTINYRYTDQSASGYTLHSGAKKILQKTDSVYIEESVHSEGFYTAEGYYSGGLSVRAELRRNLKKKNDQFYEEIASNYSESFQDENSGNYHLSITSNKHTPPHKIRMKTYCEGNSYETEFMTASQVEERFKEEKRSIL